MQCFISLDQEVMQAVYKYRESSNFFFFFLKKKNPGHI